MLTFIVPGTPTAQPRQRHRIVKLNSGASFVQNYTPAKAPVNDFKATVKIAALDALLDGRPMQGPLYLECEFIFPRPKNMIWKKKPMPRVPHDGNPDLDNLCKSVMDSIKSIGWRDDCQVCHMNAQKWIASGDEVAHTRVLVKYFEQEGSLCLVG